VVQLLLSKGTDAHGFSLVEVLVSAVFVALSVVAVVSAVSTGVRLQVTDNDRRQARTLIQSVFEEQYDFRNYNSIISNTTRTETVVIDNRDGNPLQGELTTIVRDATPGTDNGSAFPAKQVTITCTWNIDAQTADSIQLTKIVAQAQR
jgi:type II secretory pathway pseudopilin PulG